MQHAPIPVSVAGHFYRNSSVNRILAGLGVVILLCLFGGPFATGLVAERQLEARLALIGVNNPWMSATVQSYERGWFSSHAIVEFSLELNDPDPQPAPLANFVLQSMTDPIPVQIDINHGPVGFGGPVFLGLAQVTARPDSASETVASLTQMLEIPYLFEFRGRSGFFGRFTFDADVPPFSSALAVGELDFTGLNIEGYAAGRRLVIDGQFERLGLQGMLAAGFAEAARFSIDYEFLDNELPVSAAQIMLDRVVASSPMFSDEPIFELADFSIEQSVSHGADDQSLDAAARYHSATLTAGESISLSDAELAIEVTGVDREAAADYYTLMRQLSATAAPDPDQLMAEITPILEALVRRGVRINADPAGFHNDLGALDADVSIVIDGSDLPADGPVDVRNIAVMLDVVTADAQLTVAKPLARDLMARAIRGQMAASGQAMSEEEMTAAAEAQAGLMLAALAGQGMLEDDGENFHTVAEFGDGELTVNGSPMGAGLF